MVCFALCGHRQAVRPQLPKLVFAGSNPVARSIEPQTVGIPKGVGRFFNMREPLSIDMLKSGRVKFKTDPISFC